LITAPNGELAGLLQGLNAYDLANCLLVAVRTGVRPRHDTKPDYHTITPPVPPRSNGKERERSWTRFEELRPAVSGLADQGSIISYRHYWQTGLWTVAVARRGVGGPALGELRDALAHPRWPLYAGRKACGLGLPPDPDLTEEAGPVEALDSYGWPWTRHPRLREHLNGLAITVASSTAFELRYDLDYPGAPRASQEVELVDEPFHGGSGARLIRGFCPRWVGVAFTTPGMQPLFSVERDHV
jgi:CRISPR system Cascade subunit CasD